MITRDGPLAGVLLSVAAGAALGATLRWAISYWLNSRWEVLPAGTLLCNLLGGFVIGITLALFSTHISVSPMVRLLLVTGLLGGLTTFSSFSAENVTMLLSGDYLRSFLHAASHLTGSLAMTALGVWVVRSFF